MDWIVIMWYNYKKSECQRTNPEVVAGASGAVAQAYRNSFETIEFAVYCLPRDEHNFKIFKRIMTSK